MLKKLYIQNYAIIDEIEIDFSKGLNIITGETGAGKSILIGALSLILGERADTALLLKSDKKCFIEGVFGIENKQEVKAYLNSIESDAEHELFLRREIAVSGKSRAFINDTPATLQQLKHLASLLVDLHQQFDSLELGDTDFQREVLDALSGNADTLKQYQIIYKKLAQSEKELADLKEKKASFLKELDYHQFLFNELEELDLKENELEELESELKILSNAEQIKNSLSAVHFQLKESEQPLVQQLKQFVNQLHPFASFHHGLQSVIERLQSAQIELQDISEEIGHIDNSFHFDEKRIELINERMASGYKLLKKHAVTTTAELIGIRKDLEQKLQAVLDIDDAILAKEAHTAQLYAEASNLADKISAARHKHAGPFEEAVNRLLHQVGMPNARLKTEIGTYTLQHTGKDIIAFLFDANKSNRYEPIRKVASGGELSRLMLCIKSLVAQSIDLPTMIFDEIDTGISGEAAKQVGLIMKSLSANRQIICITHQAQIAGKGNAHFFVYKENRNDGIKTGIRLLSESERVMTIAQMMSGEKPTAAALENAKEIIMN